MNTTATDNHITKTINLIFNHILIDDFIDMPLLDLAMFNVSIPLYGMSCLRPMASLGETAAEAIEHVWNETHNTSHIERIVAAENGRIATAWIKAGNNIICASRAEIVTLVPTKNMRFATCDNSNVSILRTRPGTMCGICIVHETYAETDNKCSVPANNVAEGFYFHRPSGAAFAIYKQHIAVFAPRNPNDLDAIFMMRSARRRIKESKCPEMAYRISLLPDLSGIMIGKKPCYTLEDVDHACNDIASWR